MGFSAQPLRRAGQGEGYPVGVFESGGVNLVVVALPQRNPVYRSFSWGSDQIEVLGEVGRVLKDFAPHEEFELIGTVVKLEREPATVAGRVVIRTFFGGGYKLVGTLLGEELYKIATAAHEARALVSCFGELLRRGRTYELEGPRAFRIVANP